MSRVEIWVFFLACGILTGFLSCTSGEIEEASSTNIGAPVELEQANHWNIQAPDLVPNPSYAGVLLDGSLVLIDHSLNTINQFDSSGTHQLTLGGEGRGPGEYQSIIAADIHPDGRVAIADLNNARVTISSLFTEEETTFPFETGWNTQVYWTQRGLVVLNHPFTIMVSDPGDILMKLYDPVAQEMEEFYQLELEMQDPPFEQISCTFCHFRFTDKLNFYTSPSDTSYRIFRVNPGTGEEQLFSRKGVPPVSYSEEEKEQMRVDLKRAPQVPGRDPGEYEPPEFKKGFVNFFPDDEGRLWVIRYAEEGEIQKIDLFSRRADYLGTLDAPKNLKSIRYAGSGTIFVEFNTEDPDRWEGSLYRIVNR